MRALIFDFDGTMVDTETPEFHAWESVYLVHGVELPRPLWNQTVGLGKDAIRFDPFAHLEESVGRPLDRESIRQQRRKLYFGTVAASPLRDGVADYLESAPGAGLRLGLASSANREWIQGHLLHRNLWRHFDCVWTGDDVERAKPDPELYLRAASELGVDPADAIAIEDSPNGIAAARAAGLFTVATPNPITAALDLSGAHIVVESLARLPLGELLARARAARSPRHRSL